MMSNWNYKSYYHSFTPPSSTPRVRGLNLTKTYPCQYFNGTKEQLYVSKELNDFLYLHFGTC